MLIRTDSLLAPVGTHLGVDFHRHSVAEHLYESLAHLFLDKRPTKVRGPDRGVEDQFVVDRSHHVDVFRHCRIDPYHRFLEEVRAGAAHYVFGKHVESRPVVVSLRDEQSAENRARVVVAATLGFAMTCDVPASQPRICPGRTYRADLRPRSWKATPRRAVRA